MMRRDGASMLYAALAMMLLAGVAMALLRGAEESSQADETPRVETQLNAPVVQLKVRVLQAKQAVRLSTMSIAVTRGTNTEKARELQSALRPHLDACVEHVKLLKASVTPGLRELTEVDATLDAAAKALDALVIAQADGKRVQVGERAQQLSERLEAVTTAVDRLVAAMTRSAR